MDQPTPQLSYEEKKMLKEKERSGERKKLGQKKMFKTVLIFMTVVFFVGAGGVWIWSRYEPLGPDYSKAMPSEGQLHVAEGTTVQYKTNPPTSGNHWSEPLKDGIYDQEKPDEAAVHSMEHGRIIISYKPSLPLPIIEKLKEIASAPGVILFPRSKNETDIALAAWARLDTFNLQANNTLDEKRIQDFIRRYKGKGPENVPMQASTGKTYQ